MYCVYAVSFVHIILFITGAASRRTFWHFRPPRAALAPCHLMWQLSAFLFFGCAVEMGFSWTKEGVSPAGSACRGPSEAQIEKDLVRLHLVGGVLWSHLFLFVVVVVVSAAVAMA